MTNSKKTDGGKTKTAKMLPKKLIGSVHVQYVRCGKSNCKCSTGALHGPYCYRFVREGGKLKKLYVRANEVERILTAYDNQHRFEKQQRARSTASWKQLRNIRTVINESRNNYNSK